MNHSAKIFVNLDKTSKALKKAKEEVGRLTNKNEESQKTITKLRETLRFSFREQEHNKLLQEKYHLENQLQEAEQKASLAEDEVFTYEEKNPKLSELNTKLMIALNNSKGSQEALVKQISDTEATGGHEAKEDESATSSSLNASPTSSHLLPGAKGTTPKPLSKKELKKLRQKTKKKLSNMQTKEADNIPGDDDKLNNSVEELIDPVKNSLDQNDNYEEDSDNNNLHPDDILRKIYPARNPPEVGDNIEVKNVISILTNIIVPDHPNCPSSIFSHEDRPTVQAEDPSKVSPAVRDEDPSDVSADVREDPSTATDLPPHPSAVPIQYDPRATGLTEAKNSRTASTADEEVFTKQLVDIVRSFLRRHLILLVEPVWYYEWPPGPAEWDRLCDHTDGSRNSLEGVLRSWTIKHSCCSSREEFMCSPCIAAVGGPPAECYTKKPCISHTGAGKLFSQMTKGQIGNIGKLFAQVFTNSVCYVTKSELGEELWNLSPPWGALGLGYSLRDFSFNLSNYSSHHALGTLADQLVRKGMLDAATDGGEDRREDGDTDQQHQAVDAKPE